MKYSPVERYNIERIKLETFHQSNKTKAVWKEMFRNRMFNVEISLFWIASLNSYRLYMESFCQNLVSSLIVDRELKNLCKPCSWE